MQYVPYKVKETSNSKIPADDLSFSNGPLFAEQLFYSKFKAVIHENAIIVSNFNKCVLIRKCSKDPS